MLDEQIMPTEEEEQIMPTEEEEQIMPTEEEARFALRHFGFDADMFGCKQTNDWMFWNRLGMKFFVRKERRKLICRHCSVEMFVEI